MKSIVIYKSYTGHTKQYAQLLAEALQCQSIDLKQVTRMNLKAYDTIIYGGCVRASRISGIKSMLTKCSRLNKKNIVLFAVGANEKTDDNTSLLREKNLGNTPTDYPLFYMQGGFDPDKLNVLLKLMLNKVASSMRKKADKDPESLSADDRDFLKFFQSKHQDVSQENIGELLSFLNTGNKAVTLQ